MNAPVKLFQFDRDGMWVDPWGHEIRALRLLEVVEVEITGTRVENNGYGDYDARLARATDGSGRTFWQPHTVDGPSDWIAEGAVPERRWWVAANRLGRRSRYLDRDGNPITAEQLAQTSTEVSFQ